MDATFSGYSKDAAKAQALRTGGKATVRKALLEIRAWTLALADSYADALGASGMRVAYSPDINPPLWELGHLAWFQEYWVARNRQTSFGAKCDPAHERGPSLLQHADAWYDSSSVEHRSRWSLPLPDGRGTRAYLAATLEQTLALLDALPQGAGHDDLYFYRLVALHEAMHAEAATYMARSLGVRLPAPTASDQSRPVDDVAVLTLAAQDFRLGADREGFAFDNELDGHEVHLQSFSIDAQPVNGTRFNAFIEAGGYEHRRWWSDAGWEWLRLAARPRHDPSTCAEVEDTPALHLTAFEAEAWCRWAGRRLPTEAEWECAAVTAPGFRWGNAWEWTASTFKPYRGFVAHPYRDYSAPWFGSRRVLRGASNATSPWLAHPRYRNFFEPHRSDIFAGFRSCA
jgi:gamma-glutamyl hercynylcysteine S-oxide synthase